MKAWIHLLSTLNNRDEGVGVTLLPLFNGEHDMVKKISKNITELNRKGSLAPSFKQVHDPRISQARRAWGWQKFETINVQENRTL